VCGRKFFKLLSVSTLKFERVWKRVLRVVEEFQHSSLTFVQQSFSSV
jgi:hypothetical protein